MALSRLMSALLALAITGAWTSGPASAQGIEPVDKAAGPAAKNAAPASNKASAKTGKSASKSDAEAKSDPEASNRALEAGIKSYNSGKYDPAVASMSTALQSGGLPGDRVARALYYRGMAYRKQGKSAQAIADLKGALWLKSGLSDSERAEATAQHAAAYKDAGLGDAPDIQRNTVTSNASPAVAAAAPAPVASGWGATTQAPTTQAAPTALSMAPAATPEPAPSSGTGIGGFFSNLFGGGGSSAPASEPPAVASPVTTASTGPGGSPATPQVSSWVESTSVEPSRTRHAAASPPAANAATATKPASPASVSHEASGSGSAAGKFRLEVGTTTSRDEAEKIATRLKSEHAADLASRQLAIDEGKFGASKYFRVGIGPYATADEPGKLCAALKAKGMDCLVVTR